MSQEFMDHVFRFAGVLLFVFMLAPLYRVSAGPTAIDRIVAASLIGTKTAVLLVITGALFHRLEMFVDFALTYALLNFIGAIAASRYFLKARPHAGAAEGPPAAPPVNPAPSPPQ